MPLAAELMPGADDPRSNCVQMLDRSIAALPEGVQQVRCRWDAGYFCGSPVVPVGSVERLNEQHAVPV